MDTIGIKTQRAAIEIHSEPSRIVISTEQPQMKIQQTRPQMRVSRKAPTFKANWSVMRPSRGRKPQMISRKGISKAQRNALEDIMHLAKDGEKVKFGDKDVKIPEVVRERIETSLDDLNLRKSQDNPKAVEWENGYMKIEWDAHSLEIQWDPKSPKTTVEVEPYSVEVSLRNKPSVRIWVNRDEHTGELQVEKEDVRRLDARI